VLKIKVNTLTLSPDMCQVRGEVLTEDQEWGNMLAALFQCTQLGERYMSIRYVAILWFLRHVTVCEWTYEIYWMAM